MRFTSDFEILCDILDNLICISTLVRASVEVNHVYIACPIMFMGFHTFKVDALPPKPFLFSFFYIISLGRVGELLSNFQG